MSAWFLAIDFGTSNTCAATISESVARPVAFGPSATPRMPSGVLLRPDGSLVVGVEAERQAAFHPDRYDPSPKRSVGQATMLLGDREVPVLELVSAVLSSVAGHARRERGGVPPSKTCLTFPAQWGEPRRAVLLDAATRAGLGDVVLISEPEAAAAYFARHDRVAPGQQIAVYDLGGGTFDVAVLSASPEGFRIVGRPGGIDPLGGDDIDERLLRMVLERKAPVESSVRSAESSTTIVDPATLADLRTQVRRAKEDLAAYDMAEVVVPGVEEPVQLSRADLREATGPLMDASMVEFARCVSRAGRSVEQLSGIYLAGGSSRLTVVREAMARHLPPGAQRSVRTLHDPKSAVALGAAELLYAHETAPLGSGETDSDSRAPGSARSRRGKRWVQVLGAALMALALVVGLGVWLHFRESNEVSGVLRDSTGEPMAHVALHITTASGEMSKSFKTTTDAEGHYEGKLERGGYGLEAYAGFEVDGQELIIQLAPHEAGAEVVNLPASGGARIDWDLRVAGRREGRAGGNSADYWGRSATLEGWCMECDGCWAQVCEEAPIQSIAVLPGDLDVTIRFEPVGPLVDGSDSEAFEVTRSVAEIFSDTGILGHDGELYDIPAGSFVITAVLELPDETIPLVLDDYSSGPTSQLSFPLTASFEEGSQLNGTRIQLGIDAKYIYG